jgi:hypothetical protein
MGGIYEVCLEMASYGLIYIPSVIKIGMGVQAILRLYLNSCRGCNVSIADGRGL